MPTERSIPRESFVAFARSNPDSQHEVVIALQKPNLERVEAMLLERATPGHPLYQQWLSREEIDALVTPPEEAFAEVRAWLKSESISVSWVSRRRDFIRASSSVKHWERLLETQFRQYHDHSHDADILDERQRPASASPKVYHRATHYTIPTHLQKHISSIFNTVQVPPPHQQNNFRLLDSTSRRTLQGLRGRSLDGSNMSKGFSLDNISSPKSPTVVAGRALGMGNRLRSSNSVPPTAPSVTPLAPFNGGNDGVGRTVIPSFLKETYGIPVDLTGDARLRQSVFQTNSEYFSTNDLALFQRRNNLTQQVAQSIGNHDRADCPRVGQLISASCSEGNLDLQYLMGLAPNTSTVFWYVAPSPVEDPFLGWILAVADDPSPPTSNSISWGTLEQLESSTVMAAFNTEAMLLSAQGVTIVAASGDHGAANQGRTLAGQQLCLCDMDSSSSELPWMTTNNESPTFTESWSGKGYFPTFPATSPYVTAVGATMGPELGKPEVACQSQAGGVITSGGGFSTFFPRPAWQDTAVSRYFETLAASVATTPTQGYNRHGRGYPDLAFLGVEYEVIIAQETQWLYGTSTVAPVVAALVSLVNAERLRRGQKTTIGWINPTLYQAGTQNKYQTSNNYGNHNFTSSLGHVRFNDVTQGHNRCCASTTSSKGASVQPVCCQGGFRAVCGWDAVSGWGSMSFGNFSALFEESLDYPVHQNDQPSRKLSTSDVQSYNDFLQNNNGVNANISGRDLCPAQITDNRVDDPTSAKSSGAGRGTSSQTAIIVATSLIGVFFLIVAIACLVSCCSKHSAYQSRRRRYQNGRTVGSSPTDPLNTPAADTSAAATSVSEANDSAGQQLSRPPGTSGRYFLRPQRYRRHHHQSYLSQHQSILSYEDDDVRHHDDIHYDFDRQHSCSGDISPSSQTSSFCDDQDVEVGIRMVNGRRRPGRSSYHDRDVEEKEVMDEDDGDEAEEGCNGEQGGRTTDHDADGELAQSTVRSVSRTRRADGVGRNATSTAADYSNDTEHDVEVDVSTATSTSRSRNPRKSRRLQSSSTESSTDPASSSATITAVSESTGLRRLVPVAHAVPVFFCNTMSHGRNSSFVSSSLSPYASAEVTFVLDRAPPLAPPSPLASNTIVEEDAEEGEEQKR